MLQCNVYKRAKSEVEMRRTARLAHSPSKKLDGIQISGLDWYQSVWCVRLEGNIRLQKPYVFAALIRSLIVPDIRH